jgi:hypothetical protein
MNKTTIILCSAFIILLMSIVSVHADSKVDVVVAGVVSHGPMQPTIRAIEEVTSKYGDKVNVTWVNMETADGQKYMDDHKLSAHMNILINGKYQYNLNGKLVTFQWFEGQQWTKADLDGVISDLINNSGNAIPETNPTSSNQGYLWPIVIIAAIIAVATFIIIRYYKKRK